MIQGRKKQNHAPNKSSAAHTFFFLTPQVKHQEFLWTKHLSLTPTILCEVLQGLDIIFFSKPQHLQSFGRNPYSYIKK